MTGEVGHDNDAKTRVTYEVSLGWFRSQNKKKEVIDTDQAQSGFKL